MGAVGVSHATGGGVLLWQLLQLRLRLLLREQQQKQRLARAADRLRREPRCSGCVLAARAHIPVRTSLSRHIHVPLPRHTRCIASSGTLAAWLRLGRASRCVGATVGAGLARDPGDGRVARSPASCAPTTASRAMQRGMHPRKLRRPHQWKPGPRRSRRTPYSGSPGQAAHGCAAAASAHKDVRPSGDLETRSTAAPTEAALVDRTSARTSTRARAVTWRPGVCGPGRSRRFRRFRLSSAGTDRQLDQAADEACVRRATRARRRSSARNTAGVV